jgi:hypothetical protein
MSIESKRGLLSRIVMVSKISHQQKKFTLFSSNPQFSVSKISHQQKSSHFFQAIPNFRFPCHQLLIYNTPQKSSPHNDMKLANPFFLFREHYPYPLRGEKIIIPKEDKKIDHKSYS